MEIEETTMANGKKEAEIDSAKKSKNILGIRAHM